MNLDTKGCDRVVIAIFAQLIPATITLLPTNPLRDIDYWKTDSSES